MDRLKSGSKLKGRLTLALCVMTVLVLIANAALAPVDSEAAVPSPVADNMIRVHLSSYDPMTSVSMNASGTHTISTNKKSISGAFTVKIKGEALQIITSSDTYNVGSDVTIKAADLTTKHLIKINGGYSYAGDIRILLKNDKLKLVNHIDYETYLMGVLPFEVGNSWPMEAQKAQAIASRTYAYAVANSRTRSSYEHDVVNTISSQVYRGYNASYTNSIAAITATQNQVLKTTAGANVYAVFSASNGGMTAFATDQGVLASNYPYLAGGVKDDNDLDFALAHTAYSTKVTIPKTIKVGDLKSSKEQPYKMLREALAAMDKDVSAYKSDVFVNAVTLTDPVYTKPERNFKGAKIKLSSPELGAVELYFAPYKKTETVTRPFLNDPAYGLSFAQDFAVLALRDNAGSFTLASVRYGHSAGLSQAGCYQMASQAKTYKDMLKFYYGLGKETKIVTMNWPDASSTVDAPKAAAPAPAAPATPATPTPAPAPAKPKVIATGKVTSSGKLNVRSGPSTSYASIALLSSGAKVSITGSSGDWYKIINGTGEAYVYSQYIKKDAAAAAPAAAPAASAAAPAAPKVVATGKVNLTTGKLNVRSGAGMNYPSIATLAAGAKVSITATSGVWYKIVYGSGTAYVHSQFIKKDAAASTSNSAPAAAVKTGNVNVGSGSVLNVRSGPGTTYGILGTIKHGAAVSISGTNGAWYKITYSGKTGYINNLYVKLKAA